MFLRLHALADANHVVAICLPLKGEGVPLSTLPKLTTSKLAGSFFILSLYLLSAQREAVNAIFKVFCYDRFVLMWLHVNYILEKYNR